MSRNSREIRILNGRSRSCKEIKLLLSAGKWVVAKLQSDKSASHPSLPLNFVTHGQFFLILSLRSRGPGKEPKNPESPKIRKNYRKKKKNKTPHPGWGPKNTKKIPKKYKSGTKMTILYFFGIFFVFPGPHPRWGFSYFFSYFFPFFFRFFGLFTRPSGS